MRSRPAALAALASIVFLVGACDSGSASSTPATIGVSTGTAAVTRPVSGSGSQSGNRVAGNYTVVFAECMRAHGVAKFPNPSGKASQLGPDSGIDPASRAFQAAVDGACKSLAPAGWVSSGPVTKGGGS